MKRILALILCAILLIPCAAWAEGEDPPESKGKVIVLATGGTIAGVGEAGKTAGYKPGSLTAEELLLAVPELSEVAEIQAIQVCNVNSDDITSKHWVELAGAINRLAHDPEIDGFVVTHGTDTLEETAYFLNLTVKTDKPVIITGAMRPATATSADGPMNLHQSIALAGNPLARGKGVLVVFSDGIFGGRDVRKISTIQTDAFSANDFGCMGYMVDGVPHIFNAPVKPHTLATEFDVEGMHDLPPVAVAYFAVDADPEVLRFHVGRGAKGIVVAGAGAGCYSTPWNNAIIELEETGIPIVRASRIGAGLITHDDFYRGNLIDGSDLPPQKAAVLLRLALTRTNDRAEIQRMFDTY